MTIFTVDVSSWDGPVDWPAVRAAGISAACVKATEGGGAAYRYTNPLYDAQVSGAWHAELPLIGAYHCLAAGDIRHQCNYFLAAVGEVRLPSWFMLDVEPFEELRRAGVAPRFGDVEAFCDVWWSTTGHPLALYLPHWVWEQMGKPALTGLAGSTALVASNYPHSYTANFRGLYDTGGGDWGPGWAQYGGRTPDLWQFTSAGLVSGVRGGVTGCDVNAYRGDLSMLTHLLTGTGAPAPTPQGDDMLTHWTTVRRGDSGDSVRRAQGLLLAAGLPVGSANSQPDGSFGPTTENSTRSLQSRYGIAVDGIFGPHTLSCALYGRDLA